MRSFIIILFFTLFAAAALHAQDRSADSSLTVIESLYTGGEYIPAELEARRLLEQSGLNDSARVQTEKWIAFSMIAQGRSSAAKERFISLLRIDETFDLDPVLTSPKILSVFNDAKVRFLSQKKNAAADSTALNGQPMVRHTPLSFRAALFPGWEQLHQGRETTGWLLFGAGAVSFASGVACEILRADARTTYLNASTSAAAVSAYEKYNDYRKAEYYSFAAFALVYIASEVDLFNHSSMTIQPVHSQNLGNQLQLSVNF